MTEPWWRGAVIYQIYPRSFVDANGDGIGDLPGILERLDYIAGLGVDGIWLSPFFRSPMKDFGYDVADYRDVDPIFGTLADFDAVLARAHALGLKVIIDQVYSHSSDQHPWFVQSRQSRDNPKADWYVWADAKSDGTPPNNWLSVFGGVAWTWEPRRRQYYFHNFLKEQPDLNFHEPQVQDAALAVARFWLDRGVDGFRLDVANLYCHDRGLRDNPPSHATEAERAHHMQRAIHNRTQPETLAFVARLRALLDGYGERTSIAEIAAEDQIGTMIAYTDGPDRYHTAYSFVFMRETFGAALIRARVEEFLQRSNAAWPTWAFSNHDVSRVVSRWGAGVADTGAFAKCLIALLTSLQGSVCLYQGEELGLPQGEVPFDRLVDPEDKAFWPRVKRDGARTPMPWLAGAPFAGFSAVEPWLPIEPRHLALAVDRQEADGHSTLAFTRAWLAWRRQRPALVRGGMRFLDVPEPALAFVREGGGECLVCVFNLAGEPLSVRLPVEEALCAVDVPTPSSSIVAPLVELPGFGAAFARLGDEAA